MGVDIVADRGAAGVNHCWLQRVSSFGFSLSECLRYGSDGLAGRGGFAGATGTRAQPVQDVELTARAYGREGVVVPLREDRFTQLRPRCDTGSAIAKPMLPPTITRKHA
jgi:hypothetical protein